MGNLQLDGGGLGLGNGQMRRNAALGENILRNIPGPRSREPWYHWEFF
jgi:hypothetical protein